MSIFARRNWPDGPPTAPLPPPADWERLPTVNRLRSPAIAALRLPSGIYEIGWNGTWVKCWAARDEPSGEEPQKTG